MFFPTLQHFRHANATCWLLWKDPIGVSNCWQPFHHWPLWRSWRQQGEPLVGIASCSAARTAAWCPSTRSPRAWYPSQTGQRSSSGLALPGGSKDPPLPMHGALEPSSARLCPPSPTYLSRSRWLARMPTKNKILGGSLCPIGARPQPPHHPTRSCHPTF